MGRHSTPRGEKSTMGGANASPGTPGYRAKHAAPEPARTPRTTPSDVKGQTGPREGRGRVPKWLGGR